MHAERKGMNLKAKDSKRESEQIYTEAKTALIPVEAGIFLLQYGVNVPVYWSNPPENAIRYNNERQAA